MDRGVALRLSLLLGATLLVLGTIAAACDGDDRLTLDEYFERFEAIDADFDAKIDSLFEDFPDEAAEELFSNEENLPFFKELFAGFTVILTEYLDAFEELNPPAEAEDDHDEVLATARELLEVIEGNADRIEAAESISEVEQIEEQSEPAEREAVERFDAACLDLVGVGEASGLVVDVTCEE